MQKKELYAVNEALNRLDVKLKQKICKDDNPYRRSSAEEQDGKCGLGQTGSNNSTAVGLDKLWDNAPTRTASTSGGGYDKTSTDKMGEKTSAKISQDMSNLTRDQKGVVSSAFARAHEGAEIVEIRSIQPEILVKSYSHNYALLPKNSLQSH